MDAGGGLDDDPALAALREVLGALGATTPRLVFQKTLTRADIDPNQSRLHMPVTRKANALEAFLTADEKDSARDGSYCSIYRWKEAMQVPVYDRHGRRFDMSLKMLLSNSSYRLFGYQWRRFVVDNQLAEAMEVELWAFRSVELLPPDGLVETTGQHPQGALGFAILVRN